MSEAADNDFDAGRRGCGFLHLSDIHFGQEKGGELFINREIKKDVVSYLKDLAAARDEAGDPPLDGILVTGDIAFSGQEGQYRDAAAWLADIAEAIGCDKTAVHVVPGNHDVDRKLISQGVHDMIDKIVEKGQAALDSYMSDESDRERLYSRFTEYRIFAAGYGCVLDREGGAAGTKDFPLANGLKLRFVGMNSALVCRGREEDRAPGKLFLGAKQQRTVSRDDGVEQIILMHHPISWLADGSRTWDYFRTRARIFISGHEHMPNLTVEDVAGIGKVLRIDSGAIVPPRGEEGYGYTFNIIDLALGENDLELRVRVRGHIWDYKTTSFLEHTESHETLPCPQFARAKRRRRKAAKQAVASLPAAPDGASVSEAPVIDETAVSQTYSDAATFAELRLKYFHELSALQRLEVLVDLKILPTDWKGSTTPGLELAALEALVGMGRIKELEGAMAKIEGEARDGA